MELTNWAGNYTYAAARLHRPTTVDEVRAIVASSRRVKILGSRHSFNGVADTTGDLVSLHRLDRVLGVDAERRTVTVEGGVRYGALCGRLDAAGWALHNLASLPHISVAGACATGTHGSGDRNANLASAVVALDLVTADGALLSLDRDADPERFHGAVVALGALGAVVRLTLEIRPAFDVVQHVYENLALDALDAHLDAVFGGGYSVSAFTTWQAPRLDQVWLKRVHLPDEPVAPEPDLFGAAPAADDRHPLAGLSAASCTPQRGVPGRWHDRLPHFRMEFTPSNGAELQSDYLVPRAHAREAIRAVAELRARIAPLAQVCELRTVAADALWLSPSYLRDSLSIHFTWRPDWARVGALLPSIEAALAPFAPRPHWGKLFTTAPDEVAARYERMRDFVALRDALDPERKFGNDFLDAYLPNG